MEDNEMLEYLGITQTDITEVKDELVEKIKIGFHGLQEEVNSFKKLNQELIKERDELVQSNKSNSDKQELENLREEIGRYQNECTELVKIKDSLVNNDIDTKKFISDLELSSKQLESEFRTVQQEFIDKENQLQSSYNLIKSLMDENRTSQIEKSSLMIREEELKSQENRLKSQEAYLKKEIELLRKENIQLHEQLSDANSKLLVSRSELQNKCISLELELKETKHQLDIYKEMAEKKREIGEHLTKINQEYLEKIRSLQEDQLNSHEKFEAEIESMKKLLKVYKETTSDYETQIESLQSNIAQMQRSLDDGIDIIKSLNEEKDSLILENKKSLEEEKKKSLTLEQDLNRSKELFEKFRISSLSEEELSNLNPAVASTIAALKRGKSLTEIYADYVQIVEEREMLKLEKKRLNENMKEMLEELELKRPTLKANLQDFHRVQNKLAQALEELEILRNSNKKMSSAHEVNQRKISYITRQNDRLKNNCHSMACQLKTVLGELEVSRGTVIRGNKEDDSFNHSFISVEDSKHAGGIDGVASKVYKVANKAISESLNLIDENLITYRNIGELVIQNQRLLVITQDLINQLESKEADEENTKGVLKELETKAMLISEQAELNKLTLNERNMELELLKNQRDSYKKLLEKYEISIPNIDETADASAQISMIESPNKSTKSISAISKHDENLIEVIESLKEEYRKYRDDKKSSDDVYSTTIEDLRSKLNDSILKSQKLLSKLEFSEEKFKVLEMNVVGYKEEINLLREMNARYSASAAAADAEMLRLREDLLRNIEKEAKLEASLQRSVSELEQTRANENRLKSECQSLRSNEVLHSQLTSYINSLQLSLEYRESTDRQIDGHRLINLETQIKEMRSAHEYEKNEWLEAKKLLTDETSSLRKSVEEAKTECNEMREKLSKAHMELDISKKEADHFKRNSLFGVNSAPENEGVATDLKSQLLSATEKISHLEVALDSSKKLQKEFKEISAHSEKRLNEILEQNVVIQTKLQTEVDEYESKLKLLQEKLDLQEKERQTLERENIRINEEAHQMNASLKKDIQELTQLTEELKSKAQIAETHEKETRSEFDTLLNASEESKRKYERELCLHAQDLDVLSELRSKVDVLKADNDQLKIDIIKAKTDAESCRLELENQAASFNEQKKALEANQENVEKSNEVLHVELVKLSEQLVKLRKVMNEEGDKVVKEVLSHQMEDIKTSEDLLQVVEYLRKQKQILESNSECSSMEISRLLGRVEQLETKAKNLQEDLNKEREQKVSQTIMSSQIHGEMMSKIDQYNLLNESNQLLRQERDMLRQKMIGLEEKYSVSQQEFQPLREQMREQVNEIERLTMAKSSLEEESKRWKERCINLVENAQRMDPETYRQACQDRDDLLQQLQQVKTDYESRENQYEQKISQMTQDQHSAASALNEKNTQLGQAKTQLSQATERVEKLEADIAKNTSVITKLRELARKYKTEAEAANKAGVVREFNANKEKLVACEADLARANNDVLQLTERIEVTCQILNEIHSSLSNLPEGLEVAPLPPLEGSLEKKLRTFGEGLRSRQASLAEENKRQKEKLFRLKMVEAQLAKYRAKAEESNKTETLKEISPATITESSSSSASFPIKTQAVIAVQQKQMAQIKPMTSGNIATVVPTISSANNSNNTIPMEQEQPMPSTSSSTLFNIVTPQQPTPFTSSNTFEPQQGTTFGHKRTKPCSEDDDSGTPMTTVQEPHLTTSDDQDLSKRMRPSESLPTEVHVQPQIIQQQETGGYMEEQSFTSQLEPDIIAASNDQLAYPEEEEAEEDVEEEEEAYDEEEEDEDEEEPEDEEEDEGEEGEGEIIELSSDGEGDNQPIDEENDQEEEEGEEVDDEEEEGEEFEGEEEEEEEGGEDQDNLEYEKQGEENEGFEEQEEGEADDDDDQHYNEDEDSQQQDQQLAPSNEQEESQPADNQPENPQEQTLFKPATSGLFSSIPSADNKQKSTSLFGSVKTTSDPNTSSNLFSFNNPTFTTNPTPQETTVSTGKPAQIQPITWANNQSNPISQQPTTSASSNPGTSTQQQPANKRKKKWGNPGSAGGPLKKQGPRFVN